MKLLIITLAAVVSVAAPVAAETVKVLAAGSLKAPLTEIARAYEAAHPGIGVELQFGASGLLRERIEAGEAVDLFASADMGHPARLHATGKSGAPVLFARNQLCALARPLPGRPVPTADTLLDHMLDPSVRVAMSTPKADPSGDYAVAVFGKAETLRSGAKATLIAKAMPLTGGATSERAPDGRNLYGWVMDQDRADVFLTYCTNAILARAEVRTLVVVPLPASLVVGADYGLVTLTGASERAGPLAAFILGTQGQAILARFGFGGIAP